MNPALHRYGRSVGRGRFKRPRERRRCPLTALAEAIFGPLSHGEKDLLEGIALQAADSGGGLHDWAGPGPACLPVLRGAVLRWLCTSADATPYIPVKGIFIWHARIAGSLDLQSVSCKFPLLIDSCVIEETVVLAHAKFPYIRISATSVPGLEATRLQLEGSLVLIGLRTSRPVALQGALIKSNIRLDRAHLGADRDWAMNLEGATIDGALTMRNGFRSDGGIRLYGTAIGRYIECNGRIAAGGCPAALIIESTKVGGPVLLRDGFRTVGQVRVFASQMANLDFRGARLAARADFALMVYGCRLQGGLMLQRGEARHRARCVGGVRVAHCVIEGSLNMADALIRARKRPAADMENLKIGGRLHADRCRIRGEMVLNRASIGQDVSMEGAQLMNEGRFALRAHGLSCSGSLFLGKNFRAHGAVVFESAHIGDELSAADSHFEHAEGVAITLREAAVDGVVNFSGATFDGKVNFSVITVGSALYFANARFAGTLNLWRASIGGLLSMSGARFAATATLFAESIRCNGSVLLTNGFVGGAGARFYGAVIDGDFDGADAEFGAASDIALNLARARITGHLTLRMASFAGYVAIDFATIGGHVEFSGASIAVSARRDGSHEAMWGLGCSVGGDLALNKGFSANGKLELDRARIGGGLLLTACSVMNPGEVSISLRGAVVSGDVDAGSVDSLEFLDDETFLSGVFDLSKATIEGDLDLSKARMSNPEGVAIKAERLKVKGALDMRHDFAVDGMLDLRDASVGSYMDAESNWPAHGRLLLEGLSYGTISPSDPALRLRWLKHSSTGDVESAPAAVNGLVSAQPYEQVIQTLKKHGHERDARDVAVAKQDLIGRHHTARGIKKLLHWLYGVTIHYGYRPQRALYFAPPFLLALSAILYSGGSSLMVAVRPPAAASKGALAELPAGHPSFNAIAYSLDMFVPILNLQQKEAWRVNDRARCTTWPADCGFWLRVYLWFHIAAGWVITTLAVAGFTGLIRRD